jgi:hypothetical protein
MVVDGSARPPRGVDPHWDIYRALFEICCSGFVMAQATGEEMGVESFPVCKMRSVYLLAIALLVTTVLWLSTAHAQQCDIFGTAPACAGSCPNNYTELQRVDDGCKTGSKAFCCKFGPEHKAPVQGVTTTYCHWFGTGPLCAGSCPAGWTEKKRDSSGCLSGSRANCCDERDYCPIAHGGWAVCQHQQKNMIWNIKNSFTSGVEVKFFAQGRKATWPSEAGKIFAIDPGKAMDITIQACIETEQICYGAWAAGQPNGKYWGVGSDGKKGCQGCCHSCKAGKVSGDNLTK